MSQDDAMTIEDLQAVLMNMSQSQLQALGVHLFEVFKDPRGADIYRSERDSGWQECRHCLAEDGGGHLTDCDFNNAREMLGWEE